VEQVLELEQVLEQVLEQELELQLAQKEEELMELVLGLQIHFHNDHLDNVV
jgi:uncharacterized protein YcgL (UPF0745 family)